MISTIELSTPLGVGLLVWLGLLTLLVLAAVRQVALLDVRMNKAQYEGQDPADDGIDIGDALPRALATVAKLGDEGPSFVVLLSATCTTCADLAMELPSIRSDASVTVMVAGRRDQAVPIVSAVPATMATVTDPDATRIANSLQIKTVPFVFEFRRDVLVAKAALRGADHLSRFIGEALEVSDDDVDASVFGSEQAPEPLAVSTHSVNQ